MVITYSPKEEGYKCKTEQSKTMYKQKFPKPLTSEELVQHKKCFLSLIHEYPYHSHLNLFTSSALRSYRKILTFIQ